MSQSAPPGLFGAYASAPILPGNTRGLPLASDATRPDIAPGETLGGSRLPKNPSLAENVSQGNITLESLPPAAQIDPVLQTSPAQTSMPAPLLNFEGTGNLDRVVPPDPDGQIGPNHYVQMVNFTMAIYDKTGRLLYAPFYPANLWPSGDICRLHGDGDPVVLYDQLADRWLLSQFALPYYPSGPFYECIAVSRGPAPTNNPADWYVYSFLVSSNKMNDYPKLGVWPDGYYMSANQFEDGALASGVGVWVFDRAKMLSGQPAGFQYFDLANFNINYWSLLPSNLMGSAPPPPGTPNYFASVDQDWGGTTDVLHLFGFHTDWGSPQNSSFTLIKDLPVASFDGLFSGGRANIPQPGTTQKLDAIGGQLMMHLWYRNFGDYAVLLANHTVDVNGLDHAGIRWYELRSLGSDAYIYQQGTFAPDEHHRWMGSIAMDGAGNIAMGYSISSTSLYPGIRITGREAGDPLGQMTAGEAVVVNGGGYQLSTSARWGDYSAISVDPLDDCTFWYTNEYIGRLTTDPAPWQTRIASFQFPSCTAARGSLAGQITGPLGEPIAGAVVTALSAGKTFISYSTSDGSYGFSSLPAGLYTVSVDAYGYVPQTLLNIAVVEGQQTELDFQLALALTYRVSGTVRDPRTGWPLYARVDIGGYPGERVWTDPETGIYSVDLAANRAYTLQVAAWVDGYASASNAIASLSGPLTSNFSLQPILGACTAPGYTVTSQVVAQDFETSSGGYLPSGTNNEWAWGTPLTWPGACGQGSKCWGTDLSGLYQPNSDQVLVSPSIDLTAYPAGTPLGLRWKQAWSLESAVFDQASMEYSLNGGSWITAWMHQGASTQTGWTQMVLDLSQAAGKTVQLRWRLVSDAALEFPGLYVDDVVITRGCDTPPGGLVVGQVESSVGESLTGARVVAERGGSALAQLTPLDPLVGEAFFTVYAGAGTNALTASGIYGYAPQTQPVLVPAGGVLRQDMILEPGKTYLVSGGIKDAHTGWPLYAQIDIEGYPYGPVYSDPYTGQYSIALMESLTYGFRVSAWLPGYTASTRQVGPLASDQQQNFNLNVDPITCSAPGYRPVGGVQQDFSSLALPTGWTVVNNIEPASWRFDDPGAIGNLTGGGDGFATANSDYAGMIAMDTELRSPVIDLSQETQVALSFRTYFKHYEGEIADVDISTNGAAGPWTNIWRKTRVDYPGLQDPNPVILDITSQAAGKSSVMIRFHYYAANFDWYWQVDDVFIGSPECVPPAGGLVAGNVYDANNGDALVGASIASVQELLAETRAGPQSDVSPAFYTFYAPPGSLVVTASLPGGYGPRPETVDVLAHSLVQQDFFLPAGWLSYTPSALAATLEVGASTQLSLTLHNDGEWPAAFSLEALERTQALPGPIQSPSYVVKPFKQDYRPTAPSEVTALPAAPEYPGGQILRSWQTEDSWGVAYDGRRDALWLSSPSQAWGGAGALAAYSPAGSATKQQIAHSSPHTYGPADLAYDWNRGRMWVMNINSGESNCIYEVDPAAGYTGEKICPGNAAGFDASQRGLAYDPLSDTWFAGGWNEGLIYRFDRYGQILSAINTGLPVSGLAYNPHTAHLFVMVSSQESFIYVLDAAQNLKTVGRFAIPGFSAMGGAGLEIDCSSAIWAVDQTSGTVYQVSSGESTSLCTTVLPWLTTEITQGVLPALSSQAIQVALDSAVPGLEQPGEFLGQIRTLSDTPYLVDTVPVTLTLVPPPTWGLVQGTLSSSGMCDNQPAPLSGAQVMISSADGYSYSTTANPAGEYGIWLDESHSPLTVTVSAKNHVTASLTGVVVQAGQTTSQDVALRLYEPCLGLSPTSLSAALTLRHTYTTSLVLQNSGAAPASFSLQPPGPWLQLQPLSGLLPAGASLPVKVVFDAWQVDAAGVYTGEVKATASLSTARVPVTLTVSAPYGLVLDPPLQKGYGLAGTAILFKVRVTNTGTQPDLVNLTLTGAGSGWYGSLLQNQVSLAGGASAEVIVQVQVAGGALPGTKRLFTLQAVSVNDPVWVEQADMLAQSGLPPVILPLVFQR